MERETVLSWFGIVIVDRGYVYVGKVVHTKKWCEMEGAKNIRRWGTRNGLGELALNGPLSETILDPVGNIQIPAHAIISVIETDAKLWEK